MKKRKLGALLITACLALGMIGCGNTADVLDEVSTDTNATNTSNESGDVTLSVAIWDSNQEPGIKAILDDFTVETGIKTEVVVTPWSQYWTMLEAAATGGDLPDAFWMHSKEFTKYAENDMLLDFTDYITNSDMLEMDKFPTEITEMYQYDGKQLAVPKDIDTVALAYNRAMFDEAGLSYPDKSWTWDDFAEAAKLLTDTDKGQYGYALSLENDQESYFNTIYSMGGEVINADKTKAGYDQEETIAAIELMSDLTLNGYTPPYAVLAENYPENLICSGTVAMATVGSWRLPVFGTNEYAIENIGFAVLPKDAVTDERVCIYNGLGWAAAADTEHPKEAFALAEYMGSKKAQEKQSNLGTMISAYEGTATNFVNAYPDFDIEPFLDMLENIVLYPRSDSTVVWQQKTQAMFVEVWSGNISARDACLQLNEEINELLAAE